MLRKPSKGFTLVEMLVVITIIGILAAMAIPNFVKARNKAKETEARNNLSIIKNSIERYFTDQDQYPAYIAGGNRTAWLVYQDKIPAVDPVLAEIKDPLIDKGYLTEYPQNPFVDEDAGKQFQEMTDFGITAQPMGDPRFGDQGWLMANVMDDPRFWDATRTPGEPWLHFYNSRGAPTGDKVPYAKGGSEVNGRFLRNYWPGHFFYRAVGDIDMQQVSVPEGPANIWDFRIARFDHYIMGVYGSAQTKGLDIIRLNGIGKYFNDPDENFNYDVPLALPEVMGYGGTDIQPMPAFPYKDTKNNWLWGAPDGYPDGIILAFSSGGFKVVK